jgi:TRAP-type mannitol/chloroaromatic compound transport system permease small subunit
MSGALSRFDRMLSFAVSRTGAAAGWLLLAMMAVIIFDVVARRLFVVGSVRLQELEWHLHTVIFALSLGYAYVRNAHVRIDILRDRWSPRTRAWVEVAGIIVFLVPFTLLFIHFGVDFAATAFAQNERSSSPVGLPYRWIVKAVLPLGLLLLLLAGIAVLIRNALVLLGASPRPARQPPLSGS